MSEPFMGEIKIVGFGFNPRGWANCDGQLLSIAQNQALFSLFGTMYGGDGRTTFGLPDLQGRVPIHVGRGSGLPNYKQGQKGGSVSITLSTLQIPSHNHSATATSTAKASSRSAEATNPADRVWAETAGGEAIYSDTNDVDMSPQAITSSVTVNNAGGGQEHNNMQPYHVVRFIVALVGLFPSRS